MTSAPPPQIGAASAVRSTENDGQTQIQGQDDTATKSPVVDDIETRIATDWSKYDTSGDGFLCPDEFSSWMNALRGENGNGPADRATMAAAFRVADRDKDLAISRSELTAFMMERNRVKPATGH
jgi:hypothetical protein